MGYFPPRRAQTTMPCPKCRDSKMEIVRECRSAHLYCPSCRRLYPLKDFIAKADKAMEEFLENCYLDRL